MQKKGPRSFRSIIWAPFGHSTPTRFGAVCHRSTLIVTPPPHGRMKHGAAAVCDCGLHLGTPWYVVVPKWIRAAYDVGFPTKVDLWIFIGKGLQSCYRIFLTMHTELDMFPIWTHAIEHSTHTLEYVFLSPGDLAPWKEQPALILKGHL